MQLRKKTFQPLFFLFALTIFFILFYYFLKYPNLSPALFLFYLSLSLWAIIFLDYPAAKLFIFLSILLGIGRLIFVFAEGINKKIFLALELFLFWIAWQLIKKSQIREEKEKIERENRLKELDTNLTRVNQELAIYEKQLSSLATKINRFQILSLAAKELGSVLQADEVQKRLLSLLKTSFPENASKVCLEPYEETGDPFSLWIGQRLSPLLVDDLEKDLRFPEISSYRGVRSILAGPLVVEKKIVGIARIEGKQPYIFDNDDLRLLDILVLIASLSLGNAHLFSQIQELSITDTLTGLFTHKFFQERLNEEILRAGRYRSSLGLLMIDIDYFKRFNDTYGHQVGDEILKTLAKLIRKNLRLTDIVARYGGEEFVVLLLESGYQTNYEVAERIRRIIAEIPFSISLPPLKIAVSIGVASFPEEATTASQLLRLSDQRLYQAKSAGRNCVRGKG